MTCDPATLRHIRRLRIAMVFQQFGLLPWRTVRDNVGLGLELRGDSPDVRRRIIDQHLELGGLSQWGERYCSELSGGMQDWHAPWPSMRRPADDYVAELVRHVNPRTAIKGAAVAPTAP